MTLREMIEHDYQEAVQLLPEIPDELRRSLKTQERIPIFFRNLEHELIICKNLTRQQIKAVVYDMTKVFCINVKRLADERHMSDLAKLAEKAREQEFKELDKTSDGVPTGEYSEIVKGVYDGQDQKPRRQTEQAGQD